MKVKYYKDADLLSLRVSNKSYYDATRDGDLVVHYTKDGKPVLIEILNASKFLKKATRSFPMSTPKSSHDSTAIAIPLRISK